MFDTIHHIAIIGSDYEKSKHFYVDLLGFNNRSKNSLTSIGRPLKKSFFRINQHKIKYISQY